MTQHSIKCKQHWRKGNHQSRLKHLEVSIHKIIIMFWVEEFQEMVNLIIINWFDSSGVWICNRFRDIFNWKLWRVNLNITIINGTMINYPHDSWNHRNFFGRRGNRFELRWWRLDVPLSLCISWFFAMKDVGLIRLFFKTWRGKIMSTDDAGIILVSNPSTYFANALLYHAESCNNWLDIWCIIVDER